MTDQPSQEGNVWEELALKQREDALCWRLIREAKAKDDGTRVSLEELKGELGIEIEKPQKHAYEKAFEAAKESIRRDWEWAWLRSVPGFDGFLQAFTEHLVDEISPTTQPPSNE